MHKSFEKYHVSLVTHWLTRYRYQYFQEWPYRYRYRYFSNCPYRYRYRYQYFQNFLIDIDIFKIALIDIESNIDIFLNGLIDIDMLRFSSSISIFSKSVNTSINRYVLSLYRTRKGPIGSPILKHPKNWETALWGKERLYWKKGFINRQASLKERLYWKTGKFGKNCGILSKFWNLV